MDKTLRTEEILDVVWLENGGGEVRKGVLAYGLFADPERQSPPFPVDIWPAGTRFNSSRLTDEDDNTYAVIACTILPGTWPEPDQWCPTLEPNVSAKAHARAFPTSEAER